MNRWWAALLLAASACTVEQGVGENDIETGPIPPGVIDTSPHVIEGERFGQVGSAVAVVGDLDGDGFDEFVIVDNEGTGKSYLFYGTPVFPESFSVVDADAVLDEGSEFVRGLGDIDGDGLADLALVGASRGSGLVLYGSAERLAGEVDASEACSAFLSPPDARGQVFKIQNAGDVNGDGRPDLLVDTRHGQTSSIYLVHGRNDRFGETTSLSEAAALFRGQHGSEHFMVGSTPAGDVDGDGYADLLLPILTESLAKRVALYYGGRNAIQGDMTPGDAEALFELPYEWTFPSARPVGDLDGDGRDDLAIPTQESLMVFYGKARRFEGQLRSDDAAFEVLPEGPDANLSGFDVGDVDGDGAPDLVIGDSWQHQPAVQTGALYVVLGARHRFESRHTLGPAHTLWRGRALPPEENGGLGESFGAAVGASGDVNGDGRDDILVSAPASSNGDERHGRVYLFLGGPRDARCAGCSEEPVENEKEP